MDSLARIAPPDEEDVTLSKIQFITVDQVLREVDNAIGDALVVEYIPLENFLKLETARERSGRKFRFSLYDPETQNLVITIPHGPHEMLHACLYDEIRCEIVSMGLRYRWKPFAAKTFLPKGSSGGRRGEGDSSGGPFPERRGAYGFPTLVIEAGYSQSLQSLQTKARFWFDISEHDVKIVLLAKLFRNRQTIVLEKWEEGPSQPRSGATATRNMPPIEALCRQTIVITKLNGNPPAYQVTSGDLVLSFRLLFLRNPGNGEGDIVITAPGLQNYAEMVWDEFE